ncbi:M24 family metallopeptidase [Streptomyces sp. NPDC101151]|uniref:M24 family metallopeptidase n=1 Tax=Streptomyces sp. NPDC101151 TaxID=3366115 RepID=UPI0037F215F7
MAAPDRMDERLRALGLVEAQRMAQAVFADVMARGLFVPGSSEREAGNRIGDLARQMFGRAARRPGRIVRSGPHTVLPYEQEPPDRVISEDDIVVADLGPVLGGYEADFARTVAFGSDPGKHSLVEDLSKVFAAGREAFHADSGITGGQLHAEARAIAAKAGWTLGGRHIGRLAGTTPTANVHGVRADSPVQADSFLCPDNDRPLRRTVQDGWQAHWILEIHLVDEHRGFGGSHKGLLDLS